MCAGVLPQDTFVWYGKKLGTFSSPLMLQCYGWTAQQQPAEIGPNLRREEEFELNCCLSSYAGDASQEAFDSREQECMSNWSLITTALGNDASLGNIVRWAQIVEYQYTPDTGPEGGTIGELEFKVQCVQRIDSMS
jgi:hypothetical protein